LWKDLAECLLASQIAEKERKENSDSLLNGKVSFASILEDAEKKNKNGVSGSSPNNNNKSESLFALFPSNLASGSSSNALFSNLPSGEVSIKILWASTGKSETFTADKCFEKALTIYNSDADCWYGLSRAIDDDQMVQVNNGKWNRQSCLEKALTFNDQIKNAWIDLAQILPDDVRTGCAYVAMQRVSRQACFERALEIDCTITYNDKNEKVVTSSDPVSTARLWCLFGSSLKAGVWVTMHGDALDQTRCFYKALALDINCEEAWTALAFVALDSNSTLKIPIDPALSIEVDETNEDDDEDAAGGPEHARSQTPAPDSSTPVPVALKPKPKKKKQPKYIEYTAGECFERAMECRLIKNGGNDEDDEHHHRSASSAPSEHNQNQNSSEFKSNSGEHHDMDALAKATTQAGMEY
jgi:hypothetical protein